MPNILSETPHDPAGNRRNNAPVSFHAQLKVLSPADRAEPLEKAVVSYNFKLLATAFCLRYDIAITNDRKEIL